MGGMSDSSGVMYDWRVRSLHAALLSQFGVKREDPITVEQLTALGHLDQYHYLGAAATRAAARTLRLSSSSRLLDIGSGIGGPARLISAITGAEVVGVELQKGLVDASEDLTKRTGLAGKVSFRCGDASDGAVPIEEDHYHSAMSLLVLLHLPKEARRKLMKRMFDSLVAGGTLLIEDLILRPGRQLTAEEEKILKDIVFAQYVPSPAQYKKELEEVGFVDVNIEDMSLPWKRWTRARRQDFEDKQSEMEEMYGVDTIAKRGAFYRHIEGLFRGGNLGGARITARKAFDAKLESSIRHSLPLSGHCMAVADKEAQKALSKGPAVIHEGGTISKAANEADAQARMQPPFPAPGSWEGLHDSLQYHFVIPSLEICVAARAFHTPSKAHFSAWVYTPEGGIRETVCDENVSYKTEDTLSLEGAGFSVSEGGDGNGKMTLDSGLGNVIEIEFTEHNVFAWLPAGQQDCVIHRPNLTASVKLDGQVHEAWGYSKRYYGDYPEHWGYRFIHGIGKCGNKTAVVWTADACFGHSKYNYMHMLLDGRHVSSETDETFQQSDYAYGVVNGEDTKVKITELQAGVWTKDLVSSKMDSCMRQRFCALKVDIGCETFEGFALNERCYGTLR